MGAQGFRELLVLYFKFMVYYLLYSCSHYIKTKLDSVPSHGILLVSQWERMSKLKC